jgi:hypothetical protein
MIQLSKMVGTTRPRISLFMQRFHNLGLIETNKDALFHHQRKETHRLSRSDRLERLNYLKPRRPATVAWDFRLCSRLSRRTTARRLRLFPSSNPVDVGSRNGKGESNDIQYWK